MKKMLGAVALLCCLMLPSSAAARPGELDHAFGRQGRVTTKVFPGHPSKSYFAWAGGGRIVAAIGTQLVEYLPDGRLNRRFGEGGRVKIPVAGSGSFALTGLAVDSLGRILISGSASTGEGAETGPSAAVVMRFLPDGRLDMGFGDDGVALDDFGFPPPSHQEGQKDRAPFVTSSGLAVDSSNRPVLTGSWQSFDPFPCYSLYCYSTSEPFVARLEENGAPDQGFGSGGVSLASPRERAFAPTRVGDHVLFFAADVGCVARCGGPHPELAQLDDSGALDPSFGSSGTIEVGFAEVPQVVVDGSGRILLVGESRENSGVIMQRFSPRGLPDKHFGNEGTRDIVVPGRPNQGPDTIAVDRRDRMVFANGARRDHQSYIVLLRRNPRGGRDRSFGKDGRVWTRFSRSISPTQVLIGGDGKIVVGSDLPLGEGSSEARLELVRYLGR